MDKTTEKNTETDEQIEYHLARISSDIILGRCALHYCYLTISPRDYGEFQHCMSTLRHFATTAMAIHICRAFETDTRKKPTYSIITLAKHLHTANIKTEIDMFYPFSSYISDHDNKCSMCKHGEPHHMNEDCLYCLPKRLGSVIEDRCKEANELIKKVKRFRNKWVAHTEMPEEAIGTTYTDVELLASLAEDLLFPFSLYFKTKHSYSDVVRQQQAFQFSRELGRLFDILPQK